MRESLTGELAWRRRTWLSRDLELMSNERVIARLDYQGVLRARAVAESGDGAWTIARAGMLRYPFVVRDTTSGDEIARFERRWIGRGTLRFASGAEYRWSSRGAFRPTWFWAVSDGDDLMRYRTVFGWTSRIMLEVEPTAMRLAELPVLVLTGAHLMVMIGRARAH
jgi:hypothetical protein